jgi:hypothetical protein
LVAAGSAGRERYERKTKDLFKSAEALQGDGSQADEDTRAKILRRLHEFVDESNMRTPREDVQYAFELMDEIDRLPPRREAPASRDEVDKRPSFSSRAEAAAVKKPKQLDQTQERKRAAAEESFKMLTRKLAELTPKTENILPDEERLVLEAESTAINKRKKDLETKIKAAEQRAAARLTQNIVIRKVKAVFSGDDIPELKAEFSKLVAIGDKIWARLRAHDDALLYASDPNIKGKRADLQQALETLRQKYRFR